MSQQEDLDLLTRAFDSQVHQIRAHVEAFARIYWKSMPDYRQDNINRMIDAIVPRVAAGQLQIARLTNAYLLQCLTLLDLPPQTVPVDPDEITHARGMEPREVYHRPASTVYAKLAAGKSLDEAVRAGGLRLHQLIGGDMQLAHRNQAHKTLSRGRSDGIRAYRRVLTGRENCALCVVASTQRYWVEDLLPIHPGCDCNVQPLPPGMEGSQVIDQDLLDRAHAAVEDRYGSFAPDAREIDYKKMILVTEHGEYGPVMSWKETVAERRKRLRLTTPADDRFGLVGFESKKNSRKPSTTPPFMTRMLAADRSKESFDAQTRNALERIRTVGAIPRGYQFPQVLPLTKAEQTYKGGIVRGRFKENEKPPYIGIHPRLKNIQITLLHEFGHSIDWYLGNNAFASELSEVSASRRVETIHRIVNELLDTESGQSLTSDYHRSSKEVFARGFAQYIITKGSDHGLVTKVNEIHRLQRRQWATDEFAPVIPLFDALFSIE
ncbi:MAG: hypothetical protein KH751_04280 [Actinomyces sp.]|nr:hypothetical protein [Actinomyces sp.]